MPRKSWPRKADPGGMAGEFLKGLQDDLRRSWSRRLAGDGGDGAGNERGRRGTEAARREGVRHAENATE